MEFINIPNIDTGHQSLLSNPSIGDGNAQPNPATTGERDQSSSGPGDGDTLMEENESPRVASPRSNAGHMPYTSAFSLFAPLIQRTWVSDHEKLRLRPQFSSMSPEALSLSIYSSWRRRYNLTHDDAESLICQRPTDEDLRRETIPYDLLRDLLTKLTNDSKFATEKALDRFINDDSIPAEVKEGATSIYDLPLQRQDIVKQSLFNSVPYPGLLPPERWVRRATKDDLAQAPTIDTNGLDTFLRIARALAALGLSIYVHEAVQGAESHTSGLEAAIWTDLGRNIIHDWTIKQGILRFNRGDMAAYLAAPHVTMTYINMAFKEKLWSSKEFQFSSQKIVASAGKKNWAPKFEPNGQRTVLAPSARVTAIPALIQMNCWSNTEVRNSSHNIQGMLNNYFVEKETTQNLCDFPNFIRVACGGGKDRSRPQMLSSFILKGLAYDERYGYTHLACVYKLKIIWRCSSKLNDNGLRHETRDDDVQIYDSDEFQAMLRRVQDPKQSQEKDTSDGQSWTLETSPIDHCFLVLYQRVGRELNEKGFQKDWEADPEFKRMYPERSAAACEISNDFHGQGLPVRTQKKTP